AMLSKNPLYLLPLSDLFLKLGSSPNGLTGEDALRRLVQYGPNEPAPEQRTSRIVQYLRLLANPLNLILLSASLISGFLGEWVNASIIITIVLLGVTLNFLQTERSIRVIEGLREMLAPTATVLREGTWGDIPRRDLVPGDVVRLTSGDMVPADARIIEARDVHVQQAALTGESIPVEKEAGPEDLGMLYLGTSVVSGIATALVAVTGKETAFGDIAKLIGARAPETEFERGSRKFGFLIMQTVFVLVLFIFMVSAAKHREPLESFLFAIALAVGLTPEFLPMIISVTLSYGALHMARKKVIVKHLSTLQNLGSIDILCSDKTGTLTRGEITLAGHLDPLGNDSERPIFYACLNSRYETGIKSPLDAAILKHSLADIPGFDKLDEIPFDFERKRLSVVVAHEGTPIMITKGAPEGILKICDLYEVDGRSSPFDEEARKKSMEIYQRLSQEGYRLLAVAIRTFPEKRLFKAADEQKMTLLGFVSFSDPLSKDSTQAVHSLQRDGVTVKILTGDHEGVARHICAEVGLDVSRIVLGDEIDQMSDSALGAIAEKVTLFARVSPSQKNRIILALKRRGHVVGFLGDGINDAPSLHSADVGISVS
ncbi:MAG TPA: HAD-IC family P-type ATPase, partial [Nitrospiria bacterium]|nr:HAD-IC family P-type ATPase [Nitrospiria bacterium]